MQIDFTYNKDKDVWCLLNKGKNSNNSQNATKQYRELIARYGENPTTESARLFVEQYLLENKIDVQSRVSDFQHDWDEISLKFNKRASVIFNITLPENITAYLTVNSRCPYNISENYFYVSMKSTQASKIAMHELWHFYTWYGLGVDQEEKLGKEKYNDLKEALTVLLNIECKDLMHEDASDEGYPQHQEIRAKITDYWKGDSDMNNLWQYLVKLED
jgi:hypothetical protein